MLLRGLKPLIMEKQEEYGIAVRLADEKYTSSICPRCGSKNTVKRKRLFKCRDCKLEAHRDAVGCMNIALAHGLSNEGGFNGAVTRPLLFEAETSHVSA